jgi:predicted HTH domain antitoxin
MQGISIKPEFYPYLVQSEAGKTINEKVNLAITMFLFTDKKGTLVRVAELADKSIREFIDILASHGIPWAEYTKEHKYEDEETIKYILGELKRD